MIPGTDRFWRWLLITIPHTEDLGWSEHTFANDPRILLSRIGINPPADFDDDDCVGILEIFHQCGEVRLLEHHSYRTPPRQIPF